MSRWFSYAISIANAQSHLRFAISCQVQVVPASACKRNSKWTALLSYQLGWLQYLEILRVPHLVVCFVNRLI